MGFGAGGAVWIFGRSGGVGGDWNSWGGEERVAFFVRRRGNEVERIGEERKSRIGRFVFVRI